MRKILFLFFIIIFVLFIYTFTKDTKEYIFVFGDNTCKEINKRLLIKRYKSNNIEKYVNICQQNVNARDYIDQIQHNEQIIYHNKEYRMNNLLIKADIIIISIGMDELLSYDQNKNMYAYIDEVLLDVDHLLELVRYYSKEKIYVYSYYGLNRKYLDYINHRLDDISKRYNIDVIDLQSIKTN